ncbi:nucleotidyltransferase family protein [Paenibacillus illinoisensis]|uniref:nucleotidyltransferase family protein n=1 Tax=Paenibacillus illinoisensis TaxID=59845 RepID=UPI00301638A1
MRTISSEEKITQLLCKPNLSHLEVQELEQLLVTHMDWSRVVGLLILHKTSALSWLTIEKNIINKSNIKCIYPGLYRTLKSLYVMQKLRSEDQIKHLSTVCNALEKNGIKYVVLKGAIVSLTSYKNISVRDFNDNDILVHPNDLHVAQKTLKDLGYIQGLVNNKTKNIERSTRSELIKWSLASHEVHPYVKSINSSPFSEYHYIDLHFSIRLNTNNRSDDIVKRLLKDSIVIKYNNQKLQSLMVEELLIFLCIHFFSEATQIQDILKYKDLSLYKIADISYLVYNNDINWDKFTSLVKAYGVMKEVFFSFQVVNSVHNDVIPDEVLGKIIYSDSEILNYVFDYNSDNILHKWDNEILERVFDFNRASFIHSIKESKIT